MLFLRPLIMRIPIPRYIQWISLSALALLIVMSLLRVALYISHPPATDASHIAEAFFLGVRYDLRIVSIAALLLFLIGSIKPLNPVEKKAGKKLAFTLMLVFCLLITIFYTIDFANYAYLKQRMNSALVNYMEDTATSLGMIWQTYPVGWITITLIAGTSLLFYIIKLCYSFVVTRQKTTEKKHHIIWGIIFFLVAAFGIFGRIGQYPLRWSDAYTLGNDYASGLSLNPFQSFFSSLKFRNSGYDLKEVQAHYNFMSRYLETNNTNPQQISFTRNIAADSSSKQPNVILIICESFSGYKSSAFGNKLNTTPFFDSLCSKGIFFERCFTPTYGTARGVWATLTGIPDVELNKTASRNPAMVDQHLIINNFTDYKKYYFIGGSTSWANIRGVLKNNIKDLNLFEEGDYKAGRVDVWGVSDKNVFLEATEELAKQTKPFFAIIQTAGNHRPYTIADEDKDEFKIVQHSKATLNANGFDNNEELNAFRYTDFAFRKLIEAAAKKPFFNNTIFVFIGDHGIPGNASSVLPKSFTEQGLTAVHVPLLFYSPMIQSPKRLKDIASQVDVMPTIAGLSGIAYTNSSIGRDLLKPHAESNAAFNVDGEGRKIGIIKDGMFYYKSLTDSSFEKITSIENNDKVNLTPELRKKYRDYTNAFFETSRYMLFNNKKHN